MFLSRWAQLVKSRFGGLGQGGYSWHNRIRKSLEKLKTQRLKKLLKILKITEFKERGTTREVLCICTHILCFLKPAIWGEKNYSQEIVFPTLLPWFLRCCLEVSIKQGTVTPRAPAKGHSHCNSVGLIFLVSCNMCNIFWYNFLSATLLKHYLT